MSNNRRENDRQGAGVGAILLGMVLLAALAALLAVLIFMVRTLRKPVAAAGTESDTAVAASVVQTAESGTEASEVSAGEAGETQSAEQTADEGADGNPALAENWNLILVNKDHPIPDGYEVPELTELRNGNAVDSRIYPSLQQMFDDARAEGILPRVSSSYRTHEDQQKMMDNKIAEYVEQGMSQEEAEAEAKLWVAIPGTSEHELGLSVDISTADWEQQDAEVVWAWLNEHCAEYGFVQRYPPDKEEITGINNEPWHYRYVGLEAAKEMTKSGQCLEEYLGEA